MHVVQHNPCMYYAWDQCMNSNSSKYSIKWTSTLLRPKLTWGKAWSPICFSFYDISALCVLLCARFLPAMSFWLGLLSLMWPCLLVTVSLLLVRCTFTCASLAVALVPCWPALPPLLPPLRRCRHRSPPGVKCGP
jgi:hypothetical protein